jgi:microcystin-dependent protein
MFRKGTVMKTAKHLLALAGTAMAALPQPARAQDLYLGQVILVGFDFCPQGTVEANGQILSIAEHTALFALYGTRYGGDGKATFALPHLRGRVAVNAGEGPGLRTYQQGETGDAPALPVVGAPDAPAADRPEGRQHGGPGGHYLTLRYCIATQGIFPSRP